MLSPQGHGTIALKDRDPTPGGCGGTAARTAYEEGEKMRIIQRKKPTHQQRETRPGLAALVWVCLAAILLAGCGFHLNINKKEPDIEELLAVGQLTADPVKYNVEGSYAVTFRWDKGGFEKMDLSQAYVAYYPVTFMDQMESITGGETDDIPPLPADAQEAMNKAVGADQLKKIAVVTIVTVDDKTLKVSFTDREAPIAGREYYFIIPNEGLSGSVIPDQ